MKIGISTACLYPMETCRALETLLQAGFRQFEIFFNTYREFQPDYVARLRESLGRFGGKVLSVHPFTSSFEGMLLFSNYPTRLEDGLLFYRQYLEAARKLGAKFLVLHGQRLSAGGISIHDYFSRFRRLYDLGQEYGVTVCQENVAGFLSQEPAFLRRMREGCGEECAFVLDVKQAVRAGHDPYEVCDAMGNKIAHVHLNDNDEKQDCLVPGKGHMDYRRLFSQLARQGYTGDGVIEVYRSNFEDVGELVAARSLIQKLHNQMQKSLGN